MKRPLQVKQHESAAGQFWYTVDRATGSTMLTSETYPSRSNAIRAARAFIAAIAPAPVVFSYWTGDRPSAGRDYYQRPLDNFPVTERIR